MTKGEALTNFVKSSIQEFYDVVKNPDGTHVVDYTSLAGCIINLQAHEIESLKKRGSEFDYDRISGDMQTIINCLKKFGKDTKNLEANMSIFLSEDTSKKITLSNDKEVKVGNAEEERSAFIEDELEDFSLSDLESEEEVEESNPEGFNLNDLVAIDEESEGEPVGESTEEFEEEVSFHLGDPKDEEDEITEAREDSIENYEAEIKTEGANEPQEQNLDLKMEDNIPELREEDLNLNSPDDGKEKVFILGSGEKRYKKGQKNKQREQNKSIDPSFAVEFNESYKMLYEDLLKLSSQVVNYILRVSSTTTSGSAGLIDNILTIRVDLFDFEKSYDLLKTHPYHLFDDLLALIYECDVYRADKYIQTLMKTVKKSKKDKVKQILIEMRDNVRTHTSLETERHRVKTKIMSMIKTLSKIALPREDDEEANERIAKEISLILKEMSNFLSFDNKAPCINHCYKSLELFVIPALIEEYELKDMLEKKYKVHFIFIEHGAVNKDDVRRFIKEFC